VRKSLPFALMIALLLPGFTTPAAAADSDKPAASAQAAGKDGFQLPPFPADAHVTQTTTVDGRTLKYTVTVGSLPVRDDKGKTTGEVVFTAYTMAGNDRPVTFALNGGPGASSVYLHLGAIGPK
jgi:carboxypeptidase C (cathepsin A)